MHRRRSERPGALHRRGHGCDHRGLRARLRPHLLHRLRVRLPQLLRRSLRRRLKGRLLQRPGLQLLLPLQSILTLTLETSRRLGCRLQRVRRLPGLRRHPTPRRKAE